MKEKRGMSIPEIVLIFAILIGVIIIFRESVADIFSVVFNKIFQILEK